MKIKTIVAIAFISLFLLGACSDGSNRSGSATSNGVCEGKHSGRNWIESAGRWIWCQ